MHIKSFILISILCTLSHADERFSDRAWRSIERIYHEIVQHPFNQELKSGTLPKEKFDFYSKQDAFYLVDFSKSLTLLAAKIEDPNDKKIALSLARGAASERALPMKDLEPCPAALLYTSYVLRLASFDSKEELAAALLPCYWIYLKLALELKPQVRADNPYIAWIRTYSSESYRFQVEQMLVLTDRLAGSASPELQEKMSQSFVMASRMEWYFWEGAYKMEAWKP